MTEGDVSMALISDEQWAAMVRRAIELAREHASDEEQPFMDKLHFLGMADEFGGEDGLFGAIRVVKD